MLLFGHHTRGFLDIEILGHDLTPDGMTEHLIAFAVTGAVLLLLAYGAFAAVRDLRRWRRRQTAASQAGE